MAEQGSLAQALEVLGDFFDSMSPYKQEQLKRMQQFNEKVKRFPRLFPRYFVDDSGKTPRVLDIQEEYPNAKYFQFGFHRGYQHVFDDKGVRLFMCEHGIFDKREDCQKAVEHLIELRSKPFEW